MAANYYVAKTGSNGAAGDIAHPFQTLNFAVGVLTAGDTLLVRGGDYPESLISNIPSGTSWSNIVRIANYPGESVTMRPTSGLSVLWFQGSQQYIEVDGINLDASACNFYAVKIDAGLPSDLPHHIRLKNLEMTGPNATDNPGTDHGSFTVLVMVSGVRTDALGGNEFINLIGHRGADRPTSFRTDGFYIQTPGNLIEHCDFYDLLGFGIQTWNENSPRSIPDDNIIRYNKFHDFANVPGQKNEGIMLGFGNNNQVYGNVVYTIRGSTSVGIYIFGPGGNGLVYNNTVFGGSNEGIAIESGVSGTILRNNISYGNAVGNYRDSGSGTIASNNIFNINPQFVDSGNGNFRLKSTSTDALDRGMTLSLVPTDIVGTPRPQGQAYDIGAYEFVVTGPTIPQIPTGVHVAARLVP